MKSIARQLENRVVPLCVICKENPAREGCKTCSPECQQPYEKIRKKGYAKSPQGRKVYKKWRKTHKKQIKWANKTHKQALSELKEKYRWEFETILKRIREDARQNTRIK